MIYFDWNPLMKSKVLLLIVFIAGFYPFPGCDQAFKSSLDSLYMSENYLESGYDLANPDLKIKLHYDLREISGLSYFDKNKLACIQDESGKLFIIDIIENKIFRKIKFEKSGDYEGLEIVDQKVYVLKSNGKLYKFDLTSKDEAKSNEYDTPLTIKNDVEGLGFDHINGELLLACKGSPDLKDTNFKGKAIYSFNLNNETFNKLPKFLIKKKDIESFSNKSGQKLRKKIDFYPSGIAQHPINSNIYIISHIGKLLVVINPAGQIIETYPLNPKIFKQPEGICFSPNGDLFIANEGQGSRATILKFNYKK